MIILFRHAKPIIDYGSCDHRCAIERLNDYNSTCDLGLSNMGTLSDEFKALVMRNNPVVVYSSSLPRAIVTADYIFNPLGLKTNSNPVFSEFDLNIINIPKVKLPVQCWFFISRITWFLGNRNKAKSVLHEIRRSKVAAKILEKYHLENMTVILVGHGLMNRFIARYLQKRGLQVSKRTQDGFYVIK